MSEQNLAVTLVAASTSVNKNGIIVNVASIGNNGTLDRVEVTVKSDSYAASTKVLTNVGIFSKSVDFNMPLVKAKQNFTIDINVFKNGILYPQNQMKADYGFSETSLANGKWNKGTFSNRVASLEYHFTKHRNDKYVKVANVEDYLNKADSLRSSVNKDNKSGKLFNNYTVTYTESDSTKCLNKSTKQFITLTNDLLEIYSFGGN